MGSVILIIFLVYLLLSVVVVVAAHVLGKRKQYKWCNGWLAALIIFLMPTWDLPFGRIYFNYLCENKAGVVVYKTVFLPEKNFLKKGERDKRYVDWSPYAYSDGNVVKINEVKDNFIIKTVIDHRGFWGGRIKKKTTSIVDKNTNNKISEAISLYYIGNWVVKLLSDPEAIHVGADECPPVNKKEKYIHDLIIEKTFKLNL